MFAALFDDWPNLFQGFAGVVVTILGTWALTMHGVRRQLQIARRADQEQAARELLMTLQPIRKLANRLSQDSALDRLEGVAEGRDSARREGFWESDSAVRLIAELKERARSFEQLREQVWQLLNEPANLASWRVIAAAGWLTHLHERSSGVEEKESLDIQLVDLSSATDGLRRALDDGSLSRDRAPSYRALVAFLRGTLHPIRTARRVSLRLRNFWRVLWGDVRAR